MRRVAAFTLLALSFGGAAHAALSAGNVMKAYISRRSGDFAASAEYLRAALKSDPESVELRLKLSRLLMIFSEPDQALAIIDEGLKVSPDNADLYYERAKTLMLAGRNGEAADSAQKASELGGGDKANLMAVRLLANAGRGEKALELADKWVAANPRQPDAYYERAMLHLGAGAGEKAESDLRKVLEFRPDHQQAVEVLAGQLFNRNERVEAKKLYEQLVKANPHQVKGRLALAQMLVEENRIEEAKAALDEADRWIGPDPSDRTRQGLLYMQADSPDKALSALEAIPENKRDERVWLFFGLAYIELGKFEQAVKALEKIPAESAFYGDAVERKSSALKSLGKVDEALAVLKAHAAKEKDSSHAIFALANMLQGLTRYEESAKVIEDFLASHPDNRDTALIFALGVARDKLGDWEKSVAHMLRIIEINPDDAHALNYIGYTWADRGIKLDEAEKYVTKAVKLLPKNGYILDSLGWVYFKQGKYEKAVAELERASVLSPEDAVIMEHLGDARVKAGDREGAKKAYEKSLLLDSKSKTVPAKLEELR